MADSDQCYIALTKDGRCVGVSSLEPAFDTAKLVLEWLEGGLTVDVTTMGDARERLIAGLGAKTDEATG